MSTFLNSGLHVAVAVIVVGLILPVVAPPLTKAEPPECQPPESEELSSLVEAIVGSGVVSCDLQKSIYRITFKRTSFHFILSYTATGQRNNLTRIPYPHEAFRWSQPQDLLDG